MKRRGTKYPSNYVRASSFFYDEHPIATDGEWEMYAPSTWESAVSVASLGGEKARWCFAYSGNDYYFNAYTKKGPLYIFVNPSTGEKYASHPATKSWFYDAKDREIGYRALTKFLDEHPNFIVADFEDILRDAARNGWKGTWMDNTSDDDSDDGSDFTPRFASDF